MSAHVLEFFQLHKVIVPFTQHGLEKLNDHLTQYYFCGSNCRGIGVLKQVLESIRNPGGCWLACMYGVTFLVWYTCRKSFIHALHSLGLKPRMRNYCAMPKLISWLGNAM